MGNKCLAETPLQIENVDSALNTHWNKRNHFQLHIHTYVHTYVRTHIHTYINAYIQTYTHTYVHKHTHNYIISNSEQIMHRKFSLINALSNYRNIRLLKYFMLKIRCIHVAE